MTPEERSQIFWGGLSAPQLSFLARVNVDLAATLGADRVNAALENTPVEEWRGIVYQLWLSTWTPKKGEIKQ